MTPSETLAPARPRWRDFLATNRGGGLYSEAVSQRVGAGIALAAARLRLTPTALTLVNLVLGVGASVAVVALTPLAVDGRLAAWALGLGALLAWQVAYAFDCADGQLARVTGQASPAGARLDVLCDVAAQVGVVAVLSVVARAYRPDDTPVWLVAVFAGTWMVNLVTSVMQSGSAAMSMVSSRSVLARVVKLVRDYGAVVLVLGLAVAFAPQWTFVLLWAITVVNGGFLLASIAFAARAALRAQPPSER